MSDLAVPSAQQVAFVKNYEELAQVTTWKSYAVKAGTVLLALSLVNDIYKKRVAQGMAHMWCMGVNWILHNAIYVKDLEDLVPVLGATAQRYSEEIETLSHQVEQLAKLTTEHRELNEADRENLVEKRAELQKLKEQHDSLQGAIALLNTRFSGHADRFDTLLSSPGIKAHFENPVELAKVLQTKIPSANANAVDLAGKLVEALA